MSTTTAGSPEKVLDIRVLDGCVNRKAFVTESFDALAPGASLVVVNDHLPRGLQLHLEQERPGLFDWSLLQDGPQTWQVRITRRAGS